MRLLKDECTEPVTTVGDPHTAQSGDDFSKVVTPFGGRRAEYISALIIAGGAWTHHDNFRDAGRDSLEAEILAGGIVTPLLKRAFGNAPRDGISYSFFRAFLGHFLKYFIENSLFLIALRSGVWH